MLASGKSALRRAGGASDPLWYKDAIIYELHVRAFADSNGDGVGDFAGLLHKLDYLQDLGTTCLWLLPFFPSPLKDDGYDISDYLNVHPMYGTLEDFQAVLTAAHERGLQVIIELVVNHTSDQHPWFQAARQAPVGSVERNFYVWSDTDQKYGDARIIFTDTEKSNWAWDPVAQAYYWHRFFSHQPDLNFDNPQVVEEILKVMRHWLDLGVDGLRLDAIPYLVERDGTSCENLPETHAVIKTLRREIEAEYANRMILAEANQWPSDVRPYFGDGDECHMAFHFPLMPRIYMALRQEDRLPITDIMAQTPDIPETCQWALFLRNHDELTLEMVTNDERDYMYLAYSADARMRINLGIRRRLAPLMDNNRRRIELLNSLLFSFPGTPIIYYGDEIGMGDNTYLGDRNGVRTPMQWNSDRNAGFSRATPASLYSPVIMDPVWGYEAVNVEAQQSDPSSLLNWMRNMIALRKLFQVFGRGSLVFLNPMNRKVLAYLRRHADEQILCVANLSRFAQPVDLDLSELEGMTPVEMLGYVEFPRIDRQPYRLALAPYGFLWLELHESPERANARAGETEHQSPLLVAQGWEGLLEGSEARRLQNGLLPEYLSKQHWFSGKSRQIKMTRIVDWSPLPESNSALVLAEVQYVDSDAELYFLLLGMTFGETADKLRKVAPTVVISPIVSHEGPGVLHDGAFDDPSCASLLALIEDARELRARHGVIRGSPSGSFKTLRGSAADPLAVRRGSAEQSDSSIIYDGRLMLKLFRRQKSGRSPDAEIGQYLTDKVHFDGVPPFAGSIDYAPDNADPGTLAILQGFVENEGDGWKSTIEELERYYENCAPIPFPGDVGLATTDPVELAEHEVSQVARDHVGMYLESAGTLGVRTAEMHLALASPTDDPEFLPEPLTTNDVHDMLASFRPQALKILEVLKDSMARLPDEAIDHAALVLSRRRQVLDHFRWLGGSGGLGQRIRIHGDFRLNQVLRVKTDYTVLNFEGIVTRPLAERRSKQCALRDVAGMLRSFSYATHSTLINYTTRRPEDLASLEPWAQLWERSTTTEFLRAYRERTQGAAFLPEDRGDFRLLLDAYLMEQALRELLYELTNRPAWVRIPLMCIQSLLP